MRKHARRIEYITFILYFFTYNFIFNTGACLVYHRDLIRFKEFLRGILDGVKIKPFTYYYEKNYITL